LTINPYQARFLNEEGLKLEKERGTYDETKYHYYPQDKELVDKFSKPGRYLDIFFSWLVQGTMLFYQHKTTGIQKPKIVRDYIEDRIEDNDVTGSVFAKSVKQRLLNSGQRHLKR
jgi:hypothetical protein